MAQLQKSTGRHAERALKAQKTYSQAYCEARQEFKEFFACKSGEFRIFYWEDQKDVDVFDVYVDRVERVDSFFNQETAELEWLGEIAEAIEALEPPVETPTFCPACNGRGVHFYDHEVGMVPCQLCDLTGGLR